MPKSLHKRFIAAAGGAAILLITTIGYFVYERTAADRLFQKYHALSLNASVWVKPHPISRLPLIESIIIASTYYHEVDAGPFRFATRRDIELAASQTANSDELLFRGNNAVISTWTVRMREHAITLEDDQSLSDVDIIAKSLSFPIPHAREFAIQPQSTKIDILTNMFDKYIAYPSLYDADHIMLPDRRAIILYYNEIDKSYCRIMIEIMCGSDDPPSARYAAVASSSSVADLKMLSRILVFSMHLHN